MSQSIVHEDRNSTGRAPCKSVKWIEENTQIIYNELREKTDQLYNVIDTSLANVCDVNACVKNFCTVINKCVLPYCKINEHVTQNLTKKTPSKEDKPWFNENCKKLYNEYKSRLLSFNKCKSIENRQLLCQAKNIYKKTETKCKRHYKRMQGNMLNFLRKKNPK